MAKFIIPPNQDGYSVEDGNSNVSVMLDGGASRTRSDILNASSFVSVNWSFGPNEYDYFRIFYRSVTINGALPFTIDLYVDSSLLTEHQVKFVDGSIRLDSQKGLQFNVSARLEIKPLIPDAEADLTFLMLFEIYGDGSLDILDRMEKLVNVDFQAVS